MNGSDILIKIAIALIILWVFLFIGHVIGIYNRLKRKREFLNQEMIK